MKTNAEMLRTIIEYAVERGYKHVCTSVHIYGHENEWNEDICEYMVTLNESVVIDYRAVLFDKSFAKCVFGEKASHTYKGNNLRCDCGHPCTDHTRNCPLGKPDWQYRLQKCVLSDDPILYYYNFVTERREG